jgi:hypothetical protein
MGISGAVRNEWRQFWVDVRDTIRAFARNRSALVVANLLLLPWFLVIVTGRNSDPWNAFGIIFGIMFVYWFLTRRRVIEMLRVDRPIIETAIGLALVLIWMLFRVGQFGNYFELPTLSVYTIQDIFETVVPKIVEMVILPLAIWFSLRYRPRELGIRLSLRDWVPAIAPIAALVFVGLQNNQPYEWWVSIVYFFLGAGLPEEIFFRGILQPRIEALVRNPIWGLYLASLVFGISHLPINLSNATPNNWVGAFDAAFTFQLSIGFALGFAFQRVRNVLPLSGIHTLINAAP